jgi:hypothetical protein
MGSEDIQNRLLRISQELGNVCDDLCSETRNEQKQEEPLGNDSPDAWAMRVAAAWDNPIVEDEPTPPSLCLLSSNGLSDDEIAYDYYRQARLDGTAPKAVFNRNPKGFTIRDSKIFRNSDQKLVADSKDCIVYEPVFEEIHSTKWLYPVEDGPVLRLWSCAPGEWIVSTNNRVNAFTAFWRRGNKSFGDLFAELFPVELLETLNPDHCHFFILVHPDTRTVPTRLYRSKLVWSHAKKGDVRVETKWSAFPYDIQRQQMLDISEYDKYTNAVCNDTGLPRGHRGVMWRDESDQWHLHDFISHSRLQSALGNYKSIVTSFLLANDSDKKLLWDHFNKCRIHFSKAEYDAYTIEKLYYDSHVKHQVYIGNGNPWSKVIKTLHWMHKKSGQRITFKDVVLAMEWSESRSTTPTRVE